MTKELIIKRYEELANAMANIRVIDRTNGFFDLDRQAWTSWFTSALGIVRASFGSDSDHFEQLQKAIKLEDTHIPSDAVESGKGAFSAGKSRL
jgi:hypothetical protein